MHDDELEPVSRYLVNNATSATAENLYRARRSFELIGSRMEHLFDDPDHFAPRLLDMASQASRTTIRPTARILGIENATRESRY